MLLQRLAEYGRRLAEQDGAEQVPPMYQRVPIRYVLKLDRQGKLLGLIDTKSEDAKRGTVMIAPDRKRANAVKPKLLADNAEYTFGLSRADSNPERVRELHRAYVDLVGRCAQATMDAQVAAVHAFLTQFDLSEFALPADFDPSANITFDASPDVDASLNYPMHLLSVQGFWAGEASAVDQDATAMQCLVCGNFRPPAERLAISIKGIPNGQQTGMALISANSPAFESYGLEASLIAPTCEECGLLFGNTLNRLLREKDTHVRAGDLVYIFWTREAIETGWGTLLSEAKPDDVRGLLTSAFRGKSNAVDLDDTPFYAATLSASVARVVVRDWIETTVGNARRHLARYFQMQRLKDANSGETRYFPLWLLLAATKHEKSRREEAAPQVGQMLVHTALHGDPLPDWLLYQVVRRARAEQKVRPEHAALIKMVLLSQHVQGGDVNKDNDVDEMVELDRTHPEPAYHCGRLLAELEAIQRRALGDISATIVDRFYGTASSAPASVFGRLLRGAQPHLSKLRRDEKWLYDHFEQQLGEISRHIAGFPMVLTLRQQGLFALGYYHQRADNADARRQAVERRKQRVAAGITTENTSIE